MKLTYSTLAAGAFFVVATSSLASAQVTTVVTRAADPDTHSYSRAASVTGPNGRTASASSTYTNNGNGTVTRVGTRTGPNGRTRFSTATAGNGVLTSSVTRRNGTVISRARVR